MCFTSKNPPFGLCGVSLKAIFTGLFLCWGYVCMFYTQTADLDVKILDVYCYYFIFSDKNLWFSSPRRKGRVDGGD